MLNLKINIPVSVVVPCYCCSATLPRAVKSVLDQTFLPSELILVNDCSDDDGKTLKLIEEIYSKITPDIFQVKVIDLKKNMGPAFARNKGWDAAEHHYIAFLDADDAWATSKLETQYKCMTSNTLLDLTCHGSIYVSEEGFEEGVPDFNSDIRLINIESMLTKNRVATRSVMIKRSCNHRFDISMRYAEDYDLWLRIICSGCQAAYLNLNLAYVYRPEWSSGGLSRNLWAMQIGESKSLLNVYKCKEISLLVLMGVQVFSWLKFLRRVFITRIVRNG